ncbi:MAG TPA: stalk domain-containing protein [Clostridia bacterium]|nr:stalk domain-containing protein [Clostridia bacterium]
MKKITIILILILIIGSVSYANEVDNNSIDIYYNDEEINFATEPIIKNNLLMVPMRQFFESFDANVNWINETRHVLAYKGNTFIKLQIDEPISYNNGKKVTLKSPPIIENSRTLVPVEFVAKTFDMNLSWNEDRSRLDIKNKYRDNIYSYLGETFFKKYYLKNEEIEFSLPHSWSKDSDNKYSVSHYGGLQKYELTISRGYLNDLSLDEYILNIQESIQNNNLNQMIFSKISSVEFNDIQFKVMHVSRIEDEDNESKKILYFFEYDGKVYLFNFSYEGEIQNEDAVGLTNLIMNSLRISTLTINREKEHYLEFKKFFELGINLETELYANMDTNNEFTFEGTVTKDSINELQVIVEKNGQRKIFDVPVEEGNFKEKIYTPFGLGKHNITVLYNGDVNKNYNNQSIITLNREDSSVIMQFSVVNLADDNILYLIPSELVTSKDKDLTSAAKIITINQNNSFDEAKSLYKWIFNNISLVEANEITEETLNSNDPVELKDSKEVFDTSQGSKIELNILYTALLRSIDIPARITKRETIDEEIFYQTEIYLNGRWIITDIATEMLTQNNDRYSNTIYYNIYDQNYFEQFQYENSSKIILDY